MKNRLTSFLSSLRTEQLDLLTTMVNETVAREYTTVASSRFFTIAELWTIQRQEKGRIQRRFSL